MYDAAFNKACPKYTSPAEAYSALVIVLHQDKMKEINGEMSDKHRRKQNNIDICIAPAKYEIIYRKCHMIATSY